MVDLACAAEVYAQRQHLSQEAIGYATAIKVDAMTLLGEMLKAAPKNGGGRPVKEKTGPRVEPVSTLADLNITKKESSAAQALAGLKAKAPGRRSPGGT